ncbi:MAG: hypothetical protein PVG14_07575 [Anaerolineales bacterium]|jgi:hypothetical protein
MYTLILSIHNLFRWVVIVLAVIAIIRALSGWFANRKWASSDRKIGLFFSISMDIQFLLGLLLYIFLSPITKAAMSDFGAAMSNMELRFFGLEHLFYMLVAVVFVHLGSVLSRKVNEDAAKHRRAALWFTGAIIIVMLAIPWSRPLFRLPF